MSVPPWQAPSLALYCAMGILLNRLVDTFRGVRRLADHAADPALGLGELLLHVLHDAPPSRRA